MSEPGVMSILPSQKFLLVCALVLGLSGMKLTFHIAALMVLCCVFLVEILVDTPSSAPTASSLPLQPPPHLQAPPKASRVEAGKRLGEDIARTADQRDITYHMTSCWAIKAKRKEEMGGGGGRHSLLKHLSSEATATRIEALLPRKWLDITCWCEVENKSVFLCFHARPLLLLY